MLGLLDGNGAYQYRLTLFVALNYLVDDRIELACLSLVNDIGVVFSDDGSVGGYLDNVQLVYLPELVFLSQRSTCHARQLAVQSEIVLVSDGSDGLGLALYLNAFLSLDSLMQTVIEASAVHNTSCELVNYQHFAVTDDVVNALFHNAVSLDSLIDVVRQSHVLSVHEVLYVECLFCFLDTALGDGGSLSLFIDYIVAVQQVIISLVVHLDDGDGLQCLCELVSHAVQFGGLIALTRNDKRCSRLIYQYRVYLVHDGESMLSLHLILLVYYHVVTQIIEAQFGICTVGYIRVISISLG